MSEGVSEFFRSGKLSMLDAALQPHAFQGKRDRLTLSHAVSFCLILLLEPCHGTQYAHLACTAVEAVCSWCLAPFSGAVAMWNWLSEVLL